MRSLDVPLPAVISFLLFLPHRRHHLRLILLTYPLHWHGLLLKRCIISLPTDIYSWRISRCCVESEEVQR